MHIVELHGSVHYPEGACQQIRPRLAPRNEYDELDAFSMIVSTEIGDSDQECLKLQWKIEDQDEIEPLFSVQSRDGTKRPAQAADRVRYGVLRSASRASKPV